MGSVEGKPYIAEDYAEDVVEEEGEDVVMCEEAMSSEENVYEAEVVEEEGDTDVVEEEVEAEAEPDVVEEEEDVEAEVEAVAEAQSPKKKRRRGRGRGKKIVPEPIPAASKEVVKPVETKPVTKSEAMAKLNPKPILKKADLHEVVKREQILIHKMGTIGEADRVCFACSTVCKSRYQLNHHYGICHAFRSAYPKMDPNDRSWYMMIQYVRDDLAKASRLCMGCGIIFKTRHDLFRHNIRCEKAMTIDTWDRVMCFGLLYGTPYDDFAKFASKYKEPKKTPAYVERVHTFVEDLKKMVLKEKAEGRLAEERMKLLEVERVEEYVKQRLDQGQRQRQGPSQAPSQELKHRSEPEHQPSIPSEYIENCACEHCDLVKTYPPIQNPALKGVESEGYFVIPMVMDGYSTVLNNRRIYIPTQNVLLRIHDLGPADAPS
jgi:hypothetical protein